MPFTTWIRDLFGIHKDVVDVKKAKLETEKLEAQKRERDLITPATMKDIEKYDPKVRGLTTMIEPAENKPSQMISFHRSRRRIYLRIAIFLVVLAFVVLFWRFR